LSEDGQTRNGQTVLTQSFANFATQFSSMAKSGGFDRFQKKSNAAKKEEFRQEKRKWKKKREKYFEEKKRIGNPPSHKLQRASQQSAIGKPSSPGEGRSLEKVVVPRQAGSQVEQMPLNKYISNSGICSRRDAAELVKQGAVIVNGKKITEPGHKVSEKDEVKVNGKKIQLAKNFIYILLNKPKDYLTTADDPQQRKTVLDLIRVKERIFPVGRLDRNTSGVLLLTNDGELSQRLTHPSHEVKKVYHAVLNKPLEKKDFDKILKGVMLEDGIATVDVLAYADIKDKTQIGLEIHSGRNRIVRRIFEKLGYDVKNLDRVMFAGLTKKNVERGKWRFLNEKEIRNLKFFGKGKS
jgi:23S rRNA pseudouridine2605 synthase